MSVFLVTFRIKKQKHASCIKFKNSSKLSITPWSDIFAFQITKKNVICNTEPRWCHRQALEVFPTVGR